MTHLSLKSWLFSIENWIRFEQTGINQDNIYVKRIWTVSQILKKDPWDPTLLEYNNARLDFIIRAWASDNDRKVQEPIIEKGEHPVQILVAWSNQLIGQSKQLFERQPYKYLEQIGMPKSTLEKIFGKKK